MNISIRGKVRKGQKRGKKLSFSTANIRLHKQIPEGIYVSLCKIDRIEYQSLTFIGSAKTFGEKDVKAETYIFDFDKNIYGKWMSVRLLKKIRNNKKFSSKEELIKEMQNDRKKALEYFRIQKDV